MSLTRVQHSYAFGLGRKRRLNTPDVQPLCILRQEVEVAPFRLDGDHQGRGEHQREEDGTDPDMRAGVDDEGAASSLVFLLKPSSDLRPLLQARYAERLFFKNIANDIYVRGARPEIERVAGSRGSNGHATDELLHEGESIQPLQNEAVWIALAQDDPPEAAFETIEKCGFNQIPCRHGRAVDEKIGRSQPDVAHGGLPCLVCWSNQIQMPSGTAQTASRAARSAFRPRLRRRAA